MSRRSRRGERSVSDAMGLGDAARRSAQPPLPVDSRRNRRSGAGAGAGATAPRSTPPRSPPKRARDGATGRVAAAKAAGDVDVVDLLSSDDDDDGAPAKLPRRADTGSAGSGDDEERSEAPRADGSAVDASDVSKPEANASTGAIGVGEAAAAPPSTPEAWQRALRLLHRLEERMLVLRGPAAGSKARGAASEAPSSYGDIGGVVSPRLRHRLGKVDGRECGPSADIVLATQTNRSVPIVYRSFAPPLHGNIGMDSDDSSDESESDTDGSDDGSNERPWPFVVGDLAMMPSISALVAYCRDVWPQKPRRSPRGEVGVLRNARGRLARASAVTKSGKWKFTTGTNAMARWALERALTFEVAAGGGEAEHMDELLSAPAEAPPIQVAIEDVNGSIFQVDDASGSGGAGSGSSEAEDPAWLAALSTIAVIYVQRSPAPRKGGKERGGDASEGESQRAGGHTEKAGAGAGAGGGGDGDVTTPASVGGRRRSPRTRGP